MIEFKQWDAYWNNFNNGDEALFQDASLPRDTFWFKIKNWIQTQKLDFWSWVSNFYLDQITALWGKEIAWQSGSLVPEIIPLWSWTSWYDKLPFSTYWVDLATVEKKKWRSYTKWNLTWRYTNTWWIVIPATWSYIIKYYWEVYFDPNIWQTSFIVALADPDGEMYDFESKVNATNPDMAWWITIQDFRAWEELYLVGKHASASWKKALYLWTVIIFKLS